MTTHLDEKYHLLKELEKSESNSQRELAQQMGMSLGKMNFILKALVSKGLVKMENFAHSDNKIAYRYFLTPDGIKEKMKITKAFIDRKEIEYERLKKELEEAKKVFEESENQN